MTLRLLGMALFLGLLASPAVLAAGPTLTDAVGRFEAGETDVAEGLFRGLLEAEPAGAAYYLGRIEFRRGDRDGAVEWLEKAVERDASVSDHQLWLGRGYLAQLQNASMFRKLGLSKKVRACYSKAIELDPDNLSARESLAGYYFEAPGIAGGSTERGMEQIREIQARDARRGHLMLGSHYAGEESYELAQKEYLAALKLAPDDPDTLHRMGQLALTRGDSAAAFEYFEKVLKADPDNLTTLYALGRASAISAENLDRGLECLRVYLQGDPGDNLPAHTYAHWRMGLIFAHKGDTARARRAFQTALELDPDNERAHKALRELS